MKYHDIDEESTGKNAAGEHKIFRRDLNGYPWHHFTVLMPQLPPEEWPLQVTFGGLDEYIEGVFRSRINSDTFALEYVQSGSFEFIQNSNRYECLPGDLFIVHYGADSTIRTREKHATKKTIGIAGRLLPTVIDALKLNCDTISQLPGDRFNRLFDRTFELLEKRPDDCLNELSAQAYRILLELSQFRGSARYPDILSDILRHLETRHDTEITIDSLCRKFGIGSASLYRLFREHIGESPIDYLITQRLKLAANLLRNRDLPIKTIAGMVGYRNPLYFSGEFKRRYGRSPREYREKK